MRAKVNPLVPLSVPPPPAVRLMVLTNCLASLQPPRGTRRTRKSLPAPQTYRRFRCEIGPRIGISARERRKRSRSGKLCVSAEMSKQQNDFRRSRHGNFTDKGEVSSKVLARNRNRPGMINGHVPRTIAPRNVQPRRMPRFRFDFLRSASQSWRSFKRRGSNRRDQHRNELISFPLSQLLRQARAGPCLPQQRGSLYTQRVPAGRVGSFPGVVSNDGIPVRADT
jgi:hypothetical protein